MTESSKEEFNIDDDPTRIIIPRDYATSVHITKFDEKLYPSKLEDRKVRRIL
jgi:hypothetical protein